ncbi:MAG: winged helix-turn-helix domain-containing protein [Tannerella sp.]|jgi:hypothetical protein|nr:winged helix-turn-helix domain-containing protein [Tannerella sp.]
MITLIGTNAGLIWRVLNKSGRMNVKDLKKETQIRTDKQLYAAIGWLAREEKINATEEAGELYIWLR